MTPDINDNFYEDYKPSIKAGALIAVIILVAVSFVLVFGSPATKTLPYVYEYHDYSIFKLEDKTYVAFYNQSMLQAPTLQEIRGCIDQVFKEP